VTTIVAIGVQSELCVRATCRGAVDAGFAVVLLSGAHSTYDNAGTGESAEDTEKAVEQELQSIGIQIVPWNQYTF
jgi:nicotinamidase-related amidase